MSPEMSKQIHAQMDSIDSRLPAMNAIEMLAELMDAGYKLVSCSTNGDKTEADRIALTIEGIKAEALKRESC